MTSPRIGALDRRLRIEQVMRIPDDLGGATQTWSLVAEVWGEVKALGGTEAVSADGLGGRVTHSVVVRFRDDLVPAMRFVDGDRTLGIRAVLDRAGSRRWLHCLCEEEVS